MMKNPFSLAGSVSLVTGSTRGIGLAIAQMLGQCASHIVVNGRDPSRVRATRDDLADLGISVSGVPFDVTDAGAVTKAVNEIIDEFGQLDVVVANAGSTVRGSILELTPDDLHRQMAANLDSCVFLARAASPHMVKSGFGRIILISSVMGTISRPNLAAYSASKAAVNGLVAALAVELGPKGITANAVAPGYTMTDMHPQARDSDAWVKERIPLRRWGGPQDIAGAVVFLASPAGAYCNGHVLVVDGGLSVNA